MPDFDAVPWRPSKENNMPDYEEIALMLLGDDLNLHHKLYETPGVWYESDLFPGERYFFDEKLEIKKGMTDDEARTFKLALHNCYQSLISDEDLRRVAKHPETFDHMGFPWFHVTAERGTVLGDMVIKMRQDAIERRRKAQEEKNMASPEIQINWNPSATELVSKHLKRATKAIGPIKPTHIAHRRGEDRTLHLTYCRVDETTPAEVYARTAVIVLCSDCYPGDNDMLVIDDEADPYLMRLQRHDRVSLTPMPAYPAPANVDNEAPDWRTKTLPETVHIQEDRDHEMWVKANPNLGTPMQKPEPTNANDVVVMAAQRYRAIGDYLCGFVDLDYVRKFAYPLMSSDLSDAQKNTVLLTQIEDYQKAQEKKVAPLRKAIEKSKTPRPVEFNKVKGYIVHDKDGGQSFHDPSDVTIVHPYLEETVTDEINHPSHYTQYKGVEVIDITEELNFNRGNAVKYIARAGFKSEDTEIKDLQKALWYVEREIAREADSHSLGDLKSLELLVEQMNYHRGNAVWLIGGAGRISDVNTVRWDLIEATHSIKAEIKRLEKLTEDSE